MATEIRELRPADMGAYADLCAARDGLDRAAAERRAEVVSWVAFSNPDTDGNPTYFVAADGDRILAHLGRMPAAFQMGAERTRGSYIHDLFVHPEVRERGRGFFTAMKLYRAAERACPTFAALVWTNEINIALQQARKYEQLWVDGRAKVLALDARIDNTVPIEPLAVAGKLAARFALQAADVAIAAASRARRTVEVIEQFDDRFDRLADRLAGRIGVGPVKSSRYLQWKYADWPHQSWSAFAAVDGGELLGFAVVVDSAGEPPTATLAELVAAPDDIRTIAALIERSVTHCREVGMSRIQAIATDSRFARILEHHLFLKREPKLPLFLARADQAANPTLLRSPGSWHLSYGDSEGAL